jgi:hypothetical protein
MVKQPAAHASCQRGGPAVIQQSSKFEFGRLAGLLQGREGRFTGDEKRLQGQVGIRGGRRSLIHYPTIEQ